MDALVMQVTEVLHFADVQCLGKNLCQRGHQRVFAFVEVKGKLEFLAAITTDLKAAAHLARQCDPRDGSNMWHLPRARIQIPMPKM